MRQNSRKKTGAIKTLTETFHYPKRGPGMMWKTVADMVSKKGNEVHLGAEVEKIYLKNNKVHGLRINVNGNREFVNGTHFISSMPLGELIQRCEPAAPVAVVEGANNLNHWDFLTVALIIDKPDVFRDNWIYVHDPDVKVGRVQNYKNWSPHMVPSLDKTSLGLEYFCSEGDELWTMSDQTLIELGKTELEVLGLVKSSEVEDGVVVRMPKAYPVYDSTFRQSVQIISQFLEQIDNLQVVGRNGMHRYNNQDHSMLTAMLAVENVLGGEHDLWAVNEEQEYHEEVREEPSEEPALDRLLAGTFARLDKLGFATALRSVSGFLVFLATIWLINISEFL
jgi:protoporphyrinogen oxidase